MRVDDDALSVTATMRYQKRRWGGPADQLFTEYFVGVGSPNTVVRLSAKLFL